MAGRRKLEGFFFSRELAEGGVANSSNNSLAGGPIIEYLPSDLARVGDTVIPFVIVRVAVEALARGAARRGLVG